jgi:hypothetical protein
MKSGLQEYVRVGADLLVEAETFVWAWAWAWERA